MYSYGEEDRKEASRWFGLGIGWWLIMILVACAVGAAVWGISVAVSGVKGQGDAQIQKNSAPNWTQAQADFHKYYEGILADDRKINQAADDLKADPNNAVLKTNLSGLKSHCADLVATYNTKAESYLSKDFRDAGLPDRIDNTDRYTDCKEN